MVAVQGSRHDALVGDSISWQMGVGRVSDTWKG